MAVDLKEMFSRLAFDHSREYVIAGEHTDPAYVAYNCGYHARRIMELAQAVEGQLNIEAQCNQYDLDESISNAGYDLT